MAFRQSGYGRTAGIARRTDSDFTGMADVPAQLLRENTGISSQTSSAAGIPGFYTSQYGYAMTPSNYRNLTAYTSTLTEANRTALAAAGSSTNSTALMTRWAQLQGVEDRGDLNDSQLDKILPVKAEMAGQLGGFKVHLESSDVNVIEQHRKEELALNFDQWVTRKIDIADPHNSRWLQEIHPDFYARREAYIDAKINLEARLAKIRARGIKGQDDLKLLFAVDTGMVKPAQQPLFAANPQREGTDFTKGWLSIPGYFYRRTPTGTGRLGTQPHDILSGGNVLLPAPAAGGN